MFSPLLLSDVTLLHFLQDFSVKEVNGFFHVGPYTFVLIPWSLLLTYPFYKVSCFMIAHSPSCDLLVVIWVHAADIPMSWGCWSFEES